MYVGYMEIDHNAENADIFFPYVRGLYIFNASLSDAGGIFSLCTWVIFNNGHFVRY